MKLPRELAGWTGTADVLGFLEQAAIGFTVEQAVIAELNIPNMYWAALPVVAFVVTLDVLLCFCNKVFLHIPGLELTM